MNEIQTDDLRRWWIEALHDMLTAIPENLRHTAIWEMSKDQFTELADIFERPGFTADGITILGHRVRIVPDAQAVSCIMDTP